MTPQPDNQKGSVDKWFDDIFQKSVAVDLIEITGKNGHQPESTMYLWQLKEAIEEHVKQHDTALKQKLKAALPRNTVPPESGKLQDYNLGWEQALDEVNKVIDQILGGSDG